MNLLIVDDHQLFAEGLKFLLQSLDSSILTAHAKNADEALKYLKSHDNPDLILLDINLPDINGFSLMHQFQKFNVWSPVLIISATESPDAVKAAIDNGALGFISKSSDSSSLVAAIQTVIKGDVYTPETPHSDEKKINISSHITNRQKEILYLLAQGLVNKQIAIELGISANTVKAHLYDIFRSLGVKNRTTAVKVALKQGWITQI